MSAKAANAPEVPHCRVGTLSPRTGENSMCACNRYPTSTPWRREVPLSEVTQTPSFGELARPHGRPTEELHSGGAPRRPHSDRQAADGAPSGTGPWRPMPLRRPG